MTLLEKIDKITSYLGFNDRLSSSLWICVAFITIIFTLVRSPLMTENGLRSLAAPGEAYNLMKKRASLIVHVFVVIIWSLIGSLQFVPSIRKSYNFTYHKVLGYLYLIISIIVASSGLAMISIAFGGNFTAQVGTFILFVLFLICGIMGFYSIKVKNIPAHRDWMIRMFSIGTSVITMRIFTPCGLIISSALGLYTTMTCDAILYTIGEINTLKNFPSCGSPVVVSKVVSIQANFGSFSNVSAGIQIGFSVGCLPAIMIHMIIAEYWIQTRFYKAHRVDDDEVKQELKYNNEIINDNEFIDNRTIVPETNTRFE